VISKWGTGIDSIDSQTANELGIQVFRTPNAFTQPVADTVMGYILAFSRQQPWMDQGMKAGRWEKLPGRSLSECTLGVIGVGEIGKAVLERAQAFGMELLGNDIIEINQEFLEKTSVEMTSLTDLMSRADFVSINCDLNPTSHHLINKESLAGMKSIAVLINTARGQVVDELALITTLQAGDIAGAALDVFEVEPIPGDSPLLDMENVMLAPHNSNSSPTAWEHVHWNTIRNLLDGLEISNKIDELNYVGK
jgi:D-3-phosphoglycerate dehydrogenase